MIPLLFLLEYHVSVIWICTALYGLGHSAFVATNISWLEDQIGMTSKLATIFNISFYGGYAVSPILVVSLIGQSGEVVILYMLTAVSVLMGICVAIMHILSTRMKSSPLKPNQYGCVE